MRELTDDEVAALAQAERRRRTATQMRFRIAAHRGAIRLLDDLLDGLDVAPDRVRERIEPAFLSRKVHHLTTVRGLAPLVDFFKFSQRQLLDPILEPDDHD